jgi:hypothetical protein
MFDFWDYRKTPMVAAPVVGSDPSPRSELHALVLARQQQHGELAGDRFVPLLPALGEVLGVRGLQRGSTGVLDTASTPGATSLVLALLAQATGEGMWSAVFGFPTLGFAAAAELGVCLERLVLVPEVTGREAMFLSTLFDGCDIVCAALSRPLSGLDARRLVARARERRGVLVVMGAPTLFRRRPRRSWPEVADLTITVTGGSFVGLAEQGRITARTVDVEVHPRRGGAPRRGTLWLPGPDGTVTRAERRAEEEEIVPPEGVSEAEA